MERRVEVARDARHNLLVRVKQTHVYARRPVAMEAG